MCTSPKRCLIADSVQPEASVPVLRLGIQRVPKQIPVRHIERWCVKIKHSNRYKIEVSNMGLDSINEYP